MLESTGPRVVLALVVLAIATAVGLLLRARDGRRRAVGSGGPRLGDVLGPDAARGRAGGAGVTVVQISAAVCSPCRATARLWQRVAGPEHHVEIDVEHRPEVAELLSVWRTPASFVFDPDGILVARINGTPDLTRATAVLREADQRSGASA
ncbi:TlpA family protein disulfide reductase [Serinibacter arcticus]|uniref:Putative thioredoxin n=1 Tax=Serinibacter arcticus TaxID=1655435 RepID=A0A4Z1E2M3_9MICO|nr:thioredoxin family protein [Serinibacter arcticus]TGO05248.1 putative thioredoxin [Serinibacter arcticus]